ncbi:MAG: UPF0149 family protein [Pseudomonadaceae bacterium]|nr:UPF0149 family protein [Pseudomonadaceae bacterium]
MQDLTVDNEPPSSAELESMAASTTLHITTAELHGAACGIAASGIDPEWAPHRLVELLGVDAVVGEGQLIEFFTASLLALDAPTMTFEPLVGADEDPLADRMESLAAFSASFIAGFGAGVGKIDDSLDSEVTELISDLAAISQVETDIDALEENEVDFSELLEFVRVAVVLVRAHALSGSLSGDAAISQRGDDEEPRYH